MMHVAKPNESKNIVKIFDIIMSALTVCWLYFSKSLLSGAIQTLHSSSVKYGSLVLALYQFLIFLHCLIFTRY